jgi:hypothetical protein
MHPAETDDYLTARIVINSRGIKSRIQRLLSAAIQRFLCSRRGTVRSFGRAIYLVRRFARWSRPYGQTSHGCLPLSPARRGDRPLLGGGISPVAIGAAGMRTPDEIDDLQFVADWLATHSLRAERFSMAELRAGKTPDFRLYCDNRGVLRGEVAERRVVEQSA